MYCPQCLTEYREGFLECADCRVPLVMGLPPEGSRQHEIDIVTVLETGDSFALGLAKASLEEAGIEYLVSSDEPARDGSRGIFGLAPDAMPHQTCRIQVARECEEEARELLEPLRNPVESEPAI